MGADAIVAIGGDGTFLSTLRRTQAPLLGINAGTLGVLAEVDGRDRPAVDDALERLVSGRYFVDERMKIAVRAGEKSVPDAMNEVVIHCAHPARMGRFEIDLDGHRLGRIQADGIILATPTGSTGYAMSALGPIVEPGVEGIVIVPIAPFRAVSRAIVIDPLHTVAVRSALTTFPTVAVIDGQEEVSVPAEEPVVVYRSPRRARFIRFDTSYLFHLKGKGILPWSPMEKSDRESGVDADVPSPA
jgi:NAD+ kinase